MNYCTPLWKEKNIISERYLIYYSNLEFMKKRIFIGIKASNEIISKVVLWQERYEGKIIVRWLLSKNLHITLIPPWYERDIDSVFKKLSNPVNKTVPFKIRFQKITFGPNIKHPRLIWAEAEMTNKIYLLKESIEKTLDIEHEKRKLRPHLTIARFREDNFKFFKVRELIDLISWEMYVKSFQIFESKISSNGAEYEVLKEIKFH